MSKYLELATKLRISGYPFSDLSPDYFLDSQGKNCKNLSSNIEYLERERVINNFFIQKQFGDYSVCQRDKTNQTVYGGGDNPNPDTVPKGISFYVICDNRTKERVRLITNNNELMKAYFENSGSEVYRKIYPEDVIIRERKPAWEIHEKKVRMVYMPGVFVSLLVKTITFYRKNKPTLKKK